MSFLLDFGGGEAAFGFFVEHGTSRGGEWGWVMRLMILNEGGLCNGEEGSATEGIGILDWKGSCHRGLQATNLDRVMATLCQSGDGFEQAWEDL